MAAPACTAGAASASANATHAGTLGIAATDVLPYKKRAACSRVGLTECEAAASRASREARFATLLTQALAATVTARAQAVARKMPDCCSMRAGVRLRRAGVSREGSRGREDARSARPRNSHRRQACVNREKRPPTRCTVGRALRRTPLADEAHSRARCASRPGITITAIDTNVQVSTESLKATCASAVNAELTMR